MVTSTHSYAFHSRARLQPPRHGLLARILTGLAGIAVLAVAFMVSIVVLAVIAMTALAGGAYIWWKTRALRRRMRERPPGGRVIEGEATRDPD